MRAVSTFLAIGIASCIATPAAHALGFGRITNTTQLGQPLDFSAGVNLESDESLPRECVFAEVTSGENRLLPTQLRVTLEGGLDGSQRRVRVTSNAMIDEPVIAVSVTLGCNAKITRRFVAFIDPPASATASADSLPPPAAEPQRADTQVAPLLAIVQGERAAASVPVPVPRLSTDPKTTAKAAAKATTARRTAAPLPHPRHTAVAATRGPRLQLEAAAPVALIAAAPVSAGIAVPAAVNAPLAEAAASAAAMAPVSEPQAAAAERARQQRMQTLEESVATLRAQSAATDQALAQLQLKLKTAEADRYSNPLVYALSALSALLALVVAALWWRQSQGRQGAQWWTAPPPISAADDEAIKPVVDTAPSALADLALVETPADAWTSTAVFNTATTPVTAADIARIYQIESAAATATVTRPTPFQTSAPAPLPETPRELSVEELIDLEQQVEFFIVLGQDDAAIELLMSHVRSDGGTSPLPYLKLLEIYRRLGDASAYERIRDRFNRRFNAYAPDWEADLQHGRMLADYPETVAQLQTIWATPVQVMAMLDVSLFRRQPNGETFDLPAYRELLFLYSIARDLADQDGSLDPAGVHANVGSTRVGLSQTAAPVVEPVAKQAADDKSRRNETPAAIDLLLPIGDEEESAPIAQLHATTPLDVDVAVEADPLTQPLDLDVSFVPSSNASGAHALAGAWRSVGSHGPAGFRDPSGFIDFDLSEAAPQKPKSKRPDRG
jgi:hypothetical protein